MKRKKRFSGEITGVNLCLDSVNDILSYLPNKLLQKINKRSQTIAKRRTTAVKITLRKLGLLGGHFLKIQRYFFKYNYENLKTVRIWTGERTKNIIWEKRLFETAHQMYNFHPNLRYIELRRNRSSLERRNRRNGEDDFWALSLRKFLSSVTKRPFCVHASICSA